MREGSGLQLELTFSENVTEGSYRPPIGLAAAIIEQRA